MSDQTINAAIRKGGVVWHPCETCGRDWPFPKGPFGDDVPREWSCAVCANALHAKAIRTSAALSASGAGAQPTYALLGIGAKAWAELEQIEHDGQRFRCTDLSGMSIRWGTFRLVMDVLRERRGPKRQRFDDNPAILSLNGRRHL